MIPITIEEIVIFMIRLDISHARSHSKTTSGDKRAETAQKCLQLFTYRFSLFFFSQIEKQLVNEVIYEKKLGGRRPFKDSKLQVKLIQPVSSPTYIPLLARALDV